MRRKHICGFEMRITIKSRGMIAHSCQLPKSNSSIHQENIYHKQHHGDLVSVRLLSEQVLKFAKSPEEKLNTMYNTASALSYASQLQESVNVSISVLSGLGEALPESQTERDLKLFIELTKVILQGFTDQELIEYKITKSNPSKSMALKFLARLGLSYQMINLSAQPIVTLKMVQLSIAHGMSPVSSIGFTHFGQLLVLLGNV